MFTSFWTWTIICTVFKTILSELINRLGEILDLVDGRPCQLGGGSHLLRQWPNPGILQQRLVIECEQHDAAVFKTHHPNQD